MMSKQEFLHCLLRTAYFPGDLPRFFFTEDFAVHINTNFSSLNAIMGATGKLNTTAASFTAPRTVSSRRVFSIVNPQAQLFLSHVIAENREIIAKTIKQTPLTLYSVEGSFPKRLAFTGLSFRKRTIAEKKVYARSQYILRSDVTSFFHSIYTHSLAWAVHGKEAVKKSKFGPKSTPKLPSWPDDLDKAVASCQARETFGIPVGPDTSRIIAEIVMSGVQKFPPLAAALGKGHGYRLVDDFFIGFDTENQALDTLSALRKSCWSFNLQLNENKTFVSKSRDIIDTKASAVLSSFRWYGNVEEERNNCLNVLFDLARMRASELGNDEPVIFAIQRFIVEKPKIRETFAQHALLFLGREYPRSLPYILQYLISRKKLTADSTTREWILVNLKVQISFGHDFEVCCILMIASILNVAIPCSVGRLDEMGSITKCVLCLIDQRGLLEDNLDTYLTIEKFLVSDLDGADWIFIYEGALRDWFVSTDAKVAVQSHKFFQGLLVNKVTFIKDSLVETILTKAHETGVDDVQTSPWARLLRRFSGSYGD